MGERRPRCRTQTKVSAPASPSAAASRAAAGAESPGGPRGVSSSRGPRSLFARGERLMSPDVVAVLVENHRRFLEFVTRRVGSREVAEDILQEAFVRGLTRAGQLRDTDSVVAWFYRSLRNALVDHWRLRDTERRIFEDAPGGPNAEPSTDPELMTTVCECATALLDTLKP